MGVKRRDTLDRIIERLVTNPVTGCEEWTGLLNRKGYGELTAYGKNVRAHRERYRIQIGDPGDLVLRHTCDNPKCCNLSHLIPGTRADNNRDMKERGRNKNPVLPGVHNPAAKLTDDQVLSIRRDTRRQIDIAAAYGVSQSLVSMIRLERIWSHL